MSNNGTSIQTNSTNLFKVIKINLGMLVLGSSCCLNKI